MVLFAAHSPGCWRRTSPPPRGTSAQRVKAALPSAQVMPAYAPCGTAQAHPLTHPTTTPTQPAHRVPVFAAFGGGLVFGFVRRQYRAPQLLDGFDALLGVAAHVQLQTVRLSASK
jgi:hypothetical protein